MMPPAVPFGQETARGEDIIAEEMGIFRRAQIKTGQA